MTLALIEKQDNFEAVRDQVALILATEAANQYQLAQDDGKSNATDWKLRIYTERANPWEQFLDVTDTSDKSPIVNVWYDNSAYDKAGSSVVTRQKTIGTFNIDIYAHGLSKNAGINAHLAGDSEAAKNLHTALRLVRNILMAGENTYLQARGVVWGRWINSVNVFQPQQGEEPVQNIIAARIVLEIVFNEFSPQVDGDTLEYIAVDLKRAEDGKIIVEADYDYTTTT